MEEKGNEPNESNEPNEEWEENDSMFDGTDLEMILDAEPDYTLESCRVEIFEFEHLDDDGGDSSEAEGTTLVGQSAHKMEERGRAVTQVIPSQSIHSSRTPIPISGLTLSQPQFFQPGDAAAAELAKVDTLRYKREMLLWRQRDLQTKHPSEAPLQDLNFANSSFDVTQHFLHRAEGERKPAADNVRHSPQGNDGSSNSSSSSSGNSNNSRGDDAENTGLPPWGQPLDSAFWSRQIFQAFRGRV
mmetsp:Transcript_17211/g.37555  ORF Transcript_17211/g.37555 Transcript_17211/m.37555 type:complete len:244 (-) Transcript_17211:125-856(-)